MFDRDQLEQARTLVHGAFGPTPHYAWPLLAERTGAEIWVKHENHTPTGAFKVRGGLVYLDDLKRAHGDDLKSLLGLISATRGNHGQSLAFAGRRFGVPVTILVPEGNSVEKNRAMRAFGAELITHGRDFDESRHEAQRLASERGLIMVPPFHPLLVRGVATYALELFQAVPDLHTVYVPIGMGSGITGLIKTRDLLGLKTRIVGVVSEHAPAFALSFAAGHPVSTNSAQTFADGMACREPLDEAVTIVRAGAERVVRVTDAEVAEAMRAYFADTHNVAEGAGAAPLAAVMKEHEMMRERKVGLILSGGNVDSSVFAAILSGRKPELADAA